MSLILARLLSLTVALMPKFVESSRTVQRDRMCLLRAILRAILQRGSSNIASTGMRVRAVIAAWTWLRVLGAAAAAAGLH